MSLMSTLSILVLIWMRLSKMKMMELFKTLLTNKILNFLFSQLVLQWFIVLLIICRLQKQPVLITVNMLAPKDCAIYFKM